MPDRYYIHPEDNHALGAMGSEESVFESDGIVEIIFTILGNYSIPLMATMACSKCGN